MKGARIIFIGTGGLDVVPKRDCKCRLCEVSRRGGKDIRIQMGTLFNNVLIDCGFEVPQRLKEWKLEKEVDAVIISHTHKDHTFGLPDLKLKVPVFVVRSSYRLMRKLFPHLDLRIYWPDKEFSIGGEKCTAKTISHSATRFNHILKFGNQLAYSADIGEITPDLTAFVKNVKLFIGDGFSVYKDFEIQGLKMHLSMLNQLRELKKCKFDLFIFTGFGHRTKIPHEDLELLISRWAKKQGIKYGIELSFDGLAV